MCSRLSVFSIITTDWLTNWWTMLVKLQLHLKNGKWINMDTWTPCTSVFNWHNYLWFEAFNCPYDYIIQLNTKNRYREVSLLFNSPCKQQNLPFYLYGSCCINCESNTGQTAPTQQHKTELLLTNVGCCLLGKMKLVLFCLCHTS